MLFWNSIAFSMIQRMLTIWFLVLLPFLNPAWTSESSHFMYWWSLAWRILNITSMWDESNSVVVWTFWDLGSIPGLGRTPGKGKGYPLQYSGLENSMDCIVHGVTKSRTGLSDFHFHFEHSLALPFFGNRIKTDLSQSCGHCRVFQICWHIECSTFTASSFRIEIAQLEVHHLH